MSVALQFKFFYPAKIAKCFIKKRNFGAIYLFDDAYFQMISKNKTKLIQSLRSKKLRLKEQLFLVEGNKNVAEVLSSHYVVEELYATSDFLLQNQSSVQHAKLVVEVGKEAIRKASLLQNPQNSLAICRLPAEKETPKYLNDNLSIYLDEIQDPGNLGTIIRLCDWFGVDQLFCSPDSADAFNPKTIQASMGSFCRVQLVVVGFNELAEIAQLSHTPIYGAYLEGNNIYSETLPTKALMVVGNEGNGINALWESKIDRKIYIPSFSANAQNAESLNVSMATAIICSEFKREAGKGFTRNETTK